jgi:hypothetical protein
VAVRPEFVWLRYEGFGARGALTNHYAKAMDLSRQDRQRHVAFESADAVIGAQVEPKNSPGH